MTIELSEKCRSLWAKSKPQKHPLWCHLLDIAAVCKALLPRFGGPVSLPEAWVLYFVALHDIGKADKYFQAKDEALAKDVANAGFDLPELEQTKGFRHEARSAYWVRDALRGLDWTKAARNVVRQAICGHHGDFAADCENETDKTEQLWAPVRTELAEMVKGVLNMPALTLETFADASAEGIQLSGLIVLSDWIASNHDLYPFTDSSRLDPSLAPPAYFEAACAVAAATVQQLGLLPTQLDDVTLPIPFQAVWPNCKTLRPSQMALQVACEAGVAPGLAIIEAPMGEGKTEGAVYLSEVWGRMLGRSGAYIALPTQATSNQMHRRYREFLEARRPEVAGPRLIHGMAWLMSDAASATPPTTEDAQEQALAQDWFRNAKRALIAPEGVGTVDQVLMAALNVKHGFLRLLGLTQKVLIIDEVHAYDDYMTTLLCRLLSWCRALNVPVILLSATLSLAQKQALTKAYAGKDVLPPPPTNGEPYPLLTFVSRDGVHSDQPVTPGATRVVGLRLHPGLLRDPEATARLAVQETENGGCACVIVNTVRDAQAVYRHLQAIAPSDARLLLFHARFRAQHRSQIEKRVVKLFGKKAPKSRPQRAILVATQVVEQSLDVDFDVMLTQIAPIDLLLQRSGRLWRHERGPRPTGDGPVLHVLMPDHELDFGPSARVTKPHPHDPNKPGKSHGIYAMEQMLKTLVILENRVTEHNSKITLPADFRTLIEQCYGDDPLPAHRVPDAQLTEAQTWREDDRKTAENEAYTHLVPPPHAESFTYAEPHGKAVSEAEDGERASYFHARTRLGDESRNVLILHSKRLLEAAQSPDWPGMAIARRTLLQKVGVPAWWLTGRLIADGGYLDVFEGKGWLRNHCVISMRDAEWRGVRVTEDKDGKQTIKSVVITDDLELGVELKSPTEDEE